MSREVHVRFCERLRGKSPRLTLLLIEIPLKYVVSEVIGYLKGKSAISVAWQFSGRRRNFNAQKLWVRSYAVSTVGFEQAQIKDNIQNQEQ